MPAIALLVKESLSWLIKVVTTPRNIEFIYLKRKNTVRDRSKIKSTNFGGCLPPPLFGGCLPLPLSGGCLPPPPIWRMFTPTPLWRMFTPTPSLEDVYPHPSACVNVCTHP